MKKIMKKTILVSALLCSTFSTSLSAMAADRGSVDTTSSEDVLSSIVREYQTKKIVSMESGYYEIHGINADQYNEYELLIQQSQNNHDKVLAVMIPKSVRKGKNSGFGHFFEGRSVKKGSTLMLAPISLNTEGNYSIASEMDTRAPVLLVTKGAKGKFDYEYVIQGKNGALNGAMLGLVRRGDKKRHPNLRANSQKGYFASGNQKNGPELVVVGTELSIYHNGHSEKTYEMIQLNGDDMFSGLTISEFDTMAEYDVSYENVNKIAMFFDTYNGKEESVIVATPTYQEGYYRMTVYDSGTLSWIKKFFINILD